MDPKLFKAIMPSDFSITYRQSGIRLMNYHIHDQFEIMFVLKDNVKCHIDEQLYLLGRNTLLLFNNMDLHWVSFDDADNSERYVLFFRPEFLANFSTDTVNLLECFYFRPFSGAQILPLTEEQAKLVTGKMTSLMEYAEGSKADDFGSELHIKFVLGQLVLDINSIYRKKHAYSLGNKGFTQYNQVYKMMSYIHSNLSEDLSLNTLSKHFHFNKNYIIEFFKDITGATPAQYIIGCRIMKAKSLLAGGISVDQVCDQTGFNTLSHFSRMFKLHVGCSPKKFAQSSLSRLISCAEPEDYSEQKQKNN